jgi:hypothetical protein
MGDVAGVQIVLKSDFKGQRVVVGASSHI